MRGFDYFVKILYVIWKGGKRDVAEGMRDS